MLFLMMGLVGTAFSPVGKAIARRLSPPGPSDEDSPLLGEVDALREEVEALRHDLGEVHERLDFAERLLAQARAKGLGPGEGA